MKKLLLAFVLFLLPTLAFAQNNQRNPCYYLSPTNVDCQPTSSSTPFPVAPSAYPAGAIPVTASNTGTTNATTALLPAVSNKTTYVCGVSIGANATVPASSLALIGGMSFLQSVGSSPAVGGLNESFSPCVSAGSAGIGIAIVSAAAGAGGTTIVSAWGYQQ